MHPFHSTTSESMHQAQVPTSIPCTNLPIGSAFVAFQTSPTTDIHLPANQPSAINSNNHIEHHRSHLQRDTHSALSQPQTIHSNHQINQNQMALHHHAAQSLQVHESSASRYLWDPAAVAAANFHHPSAHGYVDVILLGDFFLCWFCFKFANTSIRSYSPSLPLLLSVSVS